MSNEESSIEQVDALGLPRSLWWLWPVLVALVLIWVIALWALRVPQTTQVTAVLTAHRGIGMEAQAELAVLVPSRLGTRLLGEPVEADCAGRVLTGQIIGEKTDVLGTQDLRDLLGSTVRAEQQTRLSVFQQTALMSSVQELPPPGELCHVEVVTGRVRLFELLLDRATP
ncbi:MAG: hypothetical protein EBS77_05845 [Gammaproteobacteria bacterium]|nr:hypothetical protein [Gammaproteobacteria bacterium]